MTLSNEGYGQGTNGSTTLGDQAQKLGNEVADMAKSKADELKSKANDVKNDVKNKANDLLETAKDRAGEVADNARAQFDKAKTYIQESHCDEMMDRVVDVVKAHPGKSLLVGIGLGILLGKVLK